MGSGKMSLNTKEMGAVFQALHDSYDLKIVQGDEVLQIESFTSMSDGDHLEFIINVDSNEINQLKNKNKCLIEELERVKMELRQVRGEK